MLLKKLVRMLRAKPLEEKQVLQMATRNGLKHMDYENVAKANINTLLRGPKGKASGVLIFFTDHSKPNKPIGHFCLLYRTGKQIVFFDPLGNSLHNVLKITHNRRTLLTKLNKLPNFTQNRIAYQQLAKEVQTCGRHCVTRWNAADLNEREYSALMHLPGMTPDDVVTLLTLESDLPSLVQTYKRRT